MDKTWADEGARAANAADGAVPKEGRRIHVVMAPAARHFFAGAGAENGWMVDLVDACVRLEEGIQFTCVADRVGCIDCPRVRAIGLNLPRSDLAAAVLRPPACHDGHCMDAPHARVRLGRSLWASL